MIKKKVLIFGGNGLMGKTITEDLLKNGHDVTVADVREEKVTAIVREKATEDAGNYRVNKCQYFNAEDLVGGQESKYWDIFGKWLQTFDLAVGALPSKYGHHCVELAAYYGVDFVDLSFTNKNLQRDYHEVAIKNKCLIIPDCGVAPGLSNLIVGHILARHKCDLSEVSIYVGGIAADKNINKFGYVRTWALEDLYQEYVRLARILVNGKIELLPSPLSQSEDMVEQVEVEGVGTLEAFVSDGLRTLLDLKEHIPTIIEKTLRWPGHLKEVQELYKHIGFGQKYPFFSAFEKLPVSNNDLLVMVIEGAGERYKLVDYGRPGKSAMARTTAHTCAAFAEMVLRGRCFGICGVCPPELLHLGQLDPNSCYNFILGQLKQHGIIINYKEKNESLERRIR